MSVEYDEVDSCLVGHYPCIAEEFEDKRSCGSSDALAVYINQPEDGDEYFTSFCYSCNQSFTQEQTHNSSVGGELGCEEGKIVTKKTFNIKPKSEPITKEQTREVYGWDKKYEGKGVRKLKDEWNKFFGHITKKDKHGNPIARYYPETKDGKLVGMKCRNFPKDFRYGKIGVTGQSCELSGQVKFQDMQFKDVLLVGGEEDKVAAMQMWMEYKRSRYGDDADTYNPMPIVSPTVGETGCLKQIQNNYDFINQAERIFLGFDNDDQGKRSMQEIAEIFPKEKVFIIKWSHKDPNNYLHNKEEKDFSKQFISDFYNAKPYVSMGIITSKEADSLIEEELLRPKMSLPPFMKNLQSKMAGGIPLGYIVNWIAETGIGKSTLINEAIRHWIYTSPYKIGILSLELTGAQYMITMLSREIGYKINLIEDPQEAVEFVRQPHVMEARKHLMETDDGESRFVLLDERDGDLEEVKRQCELLVNKYNCQVIIIDPIQDLFEGVDMEKQNAFIKWMKGMLKRGVTFNNVCHVRKGGNSTDKDGKRILRELNEDSVHGISAIVKSAGSNVFATRDKYEDCEVRKNVTYPTLGKCRWTGNTGRINDWYYDLETHTMYDLKEYAELFPEKIPSGFDLDYNPFEKKVVGKGKSNTPEPKTITMEVPEMEVVPTKIPEFED